MLDLRPDIFQIHEVAQQAQLIKDADTLVGHFLHDKIVRHCFVRLIRLLFFYHLIKLSVELMDVARVIQLDEFQQLILEKPLALNL